MNNQEDNSSDYEEIKEDEEISTKKKTIQNV